MITQIISEKFVVVEAVGKPSGTYTWGDFSVEELRKEKYLLVGRLLYSDSVSQSAIHVLIEAVDKEIDSRRWKGGSK